MVWILDSKLEMIIEKSSSSSPQIIDFDDWKLSRNVTTKVILEKLGEQNQNPDGKTKSWSCQSIRSLNSSSSYQIPKKIAEIQSESQPESVQQTQHPIVGDEYDSCCNPDHLLSELHQIVLNSVLDCGECSELIRKFGRHVRGSHRGLTEKPATIIPSESEETHNLNSNATDTVDNSNQNDRLNALHNIFLNPRSRSRSRHSRFRVLVTPESAESNLRVDISNKKSEILPIASHGRPNLRKRKAIDYAELAGENLREEEIDEVETLTNLNSTSSGPNSPPKQGPLPLISDDDKKVLQLPQESIYENENHPFQVIQNVKNEAFEEDSVGVRADSFKTPMEDNCPLGESDDGHSIENYDRIERDFEPDLSCLKVEDNEVKSIVRYHSPTPPRPRELPIKRVPRKRKRFIVICQPAEPGPSENIIVGDNCIGDLDGESDSLSGSNNKKRNNLGANNMGIRRTKPAANLKPFLPPRRSRPTKPRYTCQCGKTFHFACLLRYHSAVHIGEAPYKCEICNANFKYKYTLELHRRVHTGEKNLYKCKSCGRKFLRLKYFLSHKKIHEVEKPNITHTIENHPENGECEDRRNQHGDNPFTCKFCSRQFYVKSKLYLHLRKSHPETISKLQCHICKEYFMSERFLKTHVRKDHPGQMPFQCSNCSLGFLTSNLLSVHNRIHTGEKPFKCSTCNVSFKKKVSLKMHNLNHTGEKPYSCDLCKKSYTTSVGLKNHKRSHTGEKPYMCEQCSKCFTTGNGLNSHMVVHKVTEGGVRVRPYVCGECRASFTQKHHLRNHELVHTGKKTHMCEECGNCFRLAAHLRAHLKTHTKKSN